MRYPEMFIVLCASLACAQVHVTQKKLIQFGWDLTTDQLAENLSEYENKPFDGVIFAKRNLEPLDALGATTRSLFPAAFSPRILTDDWIGMDKLATLKFRKFTDNFLFFFSNDYANRDKFTYLNDGLWDTIAMNMRKVSHALVVSGCKGIALDPEVYYSPSQWGYVDKNSGLPNPHYAGKSYSEIKNAAFLRGQQFMTALQFEKKQVTVFTFGIYTFHGWYAGEGQTNDYALSAAFADGMVSVANAGSKVVDAPENGYWFERTSEYHWMRSYVKETIRDSFVAPSIRTKYDSIVSFGIPVFPNAIYGTREDKNLANGGRSFERGLVDSAKHKWMQASLYHGLLSSDEYVWVYTQPFEAAHDSFDTWNDAVPLGYFSDISFSRQAILNGLPIGFTMNGPLEFPQEDPDFRMSKPYWNEYIPMSSDSILIEAAASGTTGWVELFIDGVKQEPISVAPFQKRVKLRPGIHDVYATGYRSGNVQVFTQRIVFQVGDLPVSTAANGRRKIFQNLWNTVDLLGRTPRSRPTVAQDGNNRFH